MKRARMLRATVIYRCGAPATIEYPAGAEASIARLREEAARRDCPGCTTGGDEGGLLVSGGGRLDLWRWEDITAPGRRREDRDADPLAR